MNEMSGFEKGMWAFVVIGCMGLGFSLGFSIGLDVGITKTTTKLTHEAVREKAGTWTAGEQGEAVFKWIACVPAKPQEVKK